MLSKINYPNVNFILKLIILYNLDLTQYIESIYTSYMMLNYYSSEF